MNGRDLTLGVVGALAVAGAMASRRRGSGNASELECNPNAPKILYHLTNKRRFVIDPTFVPRQGVHIFSTPTDPELYVTDNPTYWLPWRKGPKYVAVIDVSQLCFSYGRRMMSDASEQRIEQAMNEFRMAGQVLSNAQRELESKIVHPDDGQPLGDSYAAKETKLNLMNLTLKGAAKPAAAAFRPMSIHDRRFRPGDISGVIQLRDDRFISTKTMNDALDAVDEYWERLIDAPKRALDEAEASVVRYDAYVPRDGSLPEYVIQPHAYDKVRVIETLPFKAAEAKYYDSSWYGWRTR
jgi:hypothetical protein